MSVRRELDKVMQGYEEAGSPEEHAKLAARIYEVLREPPDEPKVSELVAERLEPLAEQLEVEARRLIGTGQPWWRKLWRRYGRCPERPLRREVGDPAEASAAVIFTRVRGRCVLRSSARGVN